jgi:hypothetical protein
MKDNVFRKVYRLKLKRCSSPEVGQASSPVVTGVSPVTVQLNGINLIVNCGYLLKCFREDAETDRRDALSYPITA